MGGRRVVDRRDAALIQPTSKHRRVPVVPVASSWVLLDGRFLGQGLPNDLGGQGQSSTNSPRYGSLVSSNPQHDPLWDKLMLLFGHFALQPTVF